MQRRTSGRSYTTSARATQEHFGNGRFVANFAESVIEHHMNVTFDSNDPSTTLHIVAADIPVDKAV